MPERSAERESVEEMGGASSAALSRKSGVGASHVTIATNIEPKRYALEIEPGLYNSGMPEKFEGKLIIDADIAVPTDRIRLNAKELDVKSVYVEPPSGRRIDCSVRFDKANEEIEVRIPEQVSGPIRIRLHYSGLHNDRLIGFYRGRDGSGGHLFTTQFEAVDARAAFPCIDEPDKKAAFKLSLILKDGVSAMSNMPVVHDMYVGHGKRMVSFAETPRMSPYLLYICVGSGFEHMDGSVGGTALGVVVQRGKLEGCRLPLEYAKGIIPKLEEYFGSRYGLPKLDLIALPDFAASAMENWGAIAFREAALLGTEESALALRQRICETIAHEISHQWFGDLVTMKWWDDLWLNESFATFMELKASEAAFPQLGGSLRFFTEVLAYAYLSDAQRSTHPVHQPVRTVGEIDSSFDRISYQKGASILYMLEDFVGEGIFRYGLQNYLKRNAYSNATKEDLWQAVQEAAIDSGSAVPVTEIMSEWVGKPGYPIIEVEKTKRGFRLTQRRFSPSGDSDGEWIIPIHYITENGDRRVLMRGKEIEIEDGSDWIKLNFGQRGFYKVRYSDSLLTRLGMMIDSGRLNAVDEWGIEEDLFALAKAGSVTLDYYLDFLEGHMMSTGFPANFNTSVHLNWLTRIMDGTGKARRITELSQRFHAGLLYRVGAPEADKAVEGMLRGGLTESEGINIMVLDHADRGGLVETLGYLHDPGVEEAAKAMFQGLVEKGIRVEQDIRRAVYSIAAYSGNGETFDALVKLYRDSTDADERLRLLEAIGKVQGKELMERALAFSLSDEVKLQDSLYIPVYMISTPGSDRIVWEWMKANWEDIMARNGSGTNMLPSYITNLNRVHDWELRAEIEEFFSMPENRREDITNALGNVMETMAMNARFKEANL